MTKLTLVYRCCCTSVASSYPMRNPMPSSDIGVQSGVEDSVAALKLTPQTFKSFSHKLDDYHAFCSPLDWQHIDVPFKMIACNSRMGV